MLNSEAVWRLEVGFAFFVGLYVVLVVANLAWHGRTSTKFVGPGGIGVEAKEVESIEDSQQELQAAVAELSNGLEDMVSLFESIDPR